MSAPDEVDTPGSVELDDFALRALDRYLEAREAVRAAKAVADDAKAEVIKSMRGAEIGTVDDVPHVRVSERRSWRMDTHAFEDNHPQLYKAYLRPSATYHVITLLDADK